MRIPGVCLVCCGLFIVMGCTMFVGWRSIPPPGGCDQCHQKKISNDWALAYTLAHINSESGEKSWQMESSALPPQPSPLEQQKVTEQRCFRCHKSPDHVHKEYQGRYHHKTFF